MTREESAQNISVAIAGWQHAEIRSSGVEVNTYLDDYDRAIKGIQGGLGDKNNFLASKHESHVHVRLPQAWETFKMSLEDDVKESDKEYQPAWLMFTPLMQVSGAWRDQCYLEAADANDYLRRRHVRPVGIDLEQTVINRLKLWLPDSNDFVDAGITVEELGKQLERVSKIGSRVVNEVTSRAERGLDLGVEGSASVQIIKTAQIAWASFAVDCITLFAKQRDGRLEAVPFLEPKSISADPQPTVIYPLAPEFKGF